VERSNHRQMGNLHGKTHTYISTDGGTILDPQQREKMLGNFMAPRSMTLKVDSQVMLIKNLDETLANGSMGKVVDFSEPGTWVTGGFEVGSNLGAGGSTKKNSKEPTVKPGGPLYPVVEFLQPGGLKRKVLMTPESWKVELPNGEVQISRTQVRLGMHINEIKC
jgi:ATP-dependent DNA helicase PIF1